MKLTSKESPFAKEGRPLPHEIQEFLEYMIYWQVDNNPQDLNISSVRHVIEWLEACAR